MHLVQACQPVDLPEGVSRMPLLEVLCVVIRGASAVYLSVLSWAFGSKVWDITIFILVLWTWRILV
jgi:hypothetical protein